MRVMRVQSRRALAGAMPLAPDERDPVNTAAAVSKQRPATAVCGVRCASAEKQQDTLDTAHQRSSRALTETSRRNDDGVRVIAIEENVDDHTCRIELGFVDFRQRERSILVSRAELLSVTTLRKTLADLGASLAHIDADRLAKLSASEPRIRRRVTRRCGWHGSSTFVLPQRTLGRDQVLRYHAPQADYARARGLENGTLRGWKSGLREPIQSSSLMLFVLSACFAAPLAAQLEIEETAVFHTFGESNTGKTLLQKVAASVLGRPLETDLVGFNQTAAGLEDLMAAWNGTLITLNEMKSAEGTKDLTAKTTALAHGLTSGIGRNRSNFAKRDQDLNTKQWRLFGLTNKEESLEAMSKGRRDQGERARFIDVPVPPGLQGGIFDGLSGDPEGVAISSRRLAEQTVSTLQSHYGVAFPHFIEYLLRHQEQKRARFKKRVKDFVRKFAPEDNWEQRYATKFGYVYAGGIAAVKAGVLPCTDEQVEEGVSKVYLSSRSALRPVDDEALQRVLTLLGDRDRFPLIEKNDAAPADYHVRCLGFRRTRPGCGLCVGIQSGQLVELCGSPVAFHGLIRLLKDADAHVLGRDKAGLTNACELKGVGRKRYVLFKMSALERLRLAEQERRGSPTSTGTVM